MVTVKDSSLLAEWWHWNFWSYKIGCDYYFSTLYTAGQSSTKKSTVIICVIGRQIYSSNYIHIYNHNSTKNISTF